MRSTFSHLARNAARLPGSPLVQRSNVLTQAVGPHNIITRSRPQSTLTSSRSWMRFRAFRARPRLQKYSNRPTPDVTSQLGSPEPKLGLKDKLKELFKKYGYLSVGVYLALSALDFPFCFLAVRLAGPERIGQIEHQILSSLEAYAKPVWDVIGPAVGPVFHTIRDTIRDTIARIQKGAVKTAGVDSSEESTHQTRPKGSEAASIWTQLALAYGIHKTLLIFVRVPLTAALTPRIARALRARGWNVARGGSRAK